MMEFSGESGIAELQIGIIAHQTNPADKCVEYVVEVRHERSGHHHRVNHRYNDFFALHGKLKKRYPHLSFPEFPPKTILVAPNVARRRALFSVYVSYLQMTPTLHSDPDVLKFFLVERVVQSLRASAAAAGVMPGQPLPVAPPVEGPVIVNVSTTPTGTVTVISSPSTPLPARRTSESESEPQGVPEPAHPRRSSTVVDGTGVPEPENPRRSSTVQPTAVAVVDRPETAPVALAPSGAAAQHVDGFGQPRAFPPTPADAATPAAPATAAATDAATPAAPVTTAPAAPVAAATDVPVAATPVAAAPVTADSVEIVWPSSYARRASVTSSSSSGSGQGLARSQSATIPRERSSSSNGSHGLRASASESLPSSTAQQVRPATSSTTVTADSVEIVWPSSYAAPSSRRASVTSSTDSNNQRARSQSSSSSSVGSSGLRKSAGSQNLHASTSESLRSSETYAVLPPLDSPPEWMLNPPPVDTSNLVFPPSYMAFVTSTIPTPESTPPNVRFMAARSESVESQGPSDERRVLRSWSSFENGATPDAHQGADAPIDPVASNSNSDTDAPDHEPDQFMVEQVEASVIHDANAAQEEALQQQEDVQPLSAEPSLTMDADATQGASERRPSKSAKRKAKKAARVVTIN
eukprot:TRINITY_DN8890_c0_g1_i1.p1 TRINITY_DN8890_c0_g1~~TRINITY_DN8890_c0_g1_i1.p1  ORF type:complete len:651 (-),score=154.56 TRINITY_DN8890_c0_g1_i1:325-2238(-)